MIQYTNIIKSIGDTPLISLDNFTSRISSKIYAKCEFMNPSGSMKDRIAKEIIERAEKSGEIKKGDKIIMLTSGNAGIALSTICAAKGYELIITMSEGNSIERRKIIEALGAKLILVPQVKDSIPGQVSSEDLEAVEKKTTELARKYKAFKIDQFTNKYNSIAHETTGREIINQTSENINAFITLLGTSGTFTGISKVLKTNDKNIKCYAVEPATAQYLAKKRITNTNHKLQGGGYSRPLPLFNNEICDGFIPIKDSEAIKTCRDLAKLEGLLVGFSAGANVCAAYKIAKKLDNGIVVTILCDSGMKYLTTDLYEK